MWQLSLSIAVSQPKAPFGGKAYRLKKNILEHQLVNQAQKMFRDAIELHQSKKLKERNFGVAKVFLKKRIPLFFYLHIGFYFCEKIAMGGTSETR